MTPSSPQCATWRFQLIGLARSMSEECSRPERTSSTSPSAPSRTRAAARCAPGKNGSSLDTRTKTPAASIAATIRSAAPRSMPNGFSPRKSFPAATVSR